MNTRVVSDTAEKPVWRVIHLERSTNIAFASDLILVSILRIPAQVSVYKERLILVNFHEGRPVNNIIALSVYLHPGNRAMFWSKSLKTAFRTNLP